MSKSRPRRDEAGPCSSGAAMGEPEAHKLWIHCNCCCELFATKKSVFFLLACHHVSCERCIKVAAGRTPSDAPIFGCPTCKQSVRGRQVNNAMPNNFKHLFHPEPYGLTNDFVEKFQRGNHRHFDKHKEKKENEIDKLYTDIDLVKSVCQKRFLELQMIRMERKRMVQRSRQLKVQVANEKAQKQRISQAKKNSTFFAQESVLRCARGGGTSQVSTRQRSWKESGRSPSAKRRKVTSFIHQPNNSFNL
ncbi:RING finger protein vilya [Drosophila rhopaloa]|uniref:RING finger protein vilya n=1 Tax=Drosophila rhopaloa TaxID=1041015 RepID=A0A6P4F1E9_DRORH|nr:RING finger protein vilya [Drosophila rhopaloa]